MSVLIKGMELPRSCLECPCTDGDDDYDCVCNFSKDPCLMYGRQPTCPLVKAPERKHGIWLYEGMIDKAWRVYTCSLCGGKCIDGGAYCPTCGAEMRYEDDA